jgi:hypothetical protein
MMQLNSLLHLHSFPFKLIQPDPELELMVFQMPPMCQTKKLCNAPTLPDTPTNSSTHHTSIVFNRRFVAGILQVALFNKASLHCASKLQCFGIIEIIKETLTAVVLKKR